MKKGDYKKLYYDELKTGKNKRRYPWHEGRKKAAYVWLRGDDGEIQAVARMTTKHKPEKEAVLRGPEDLKDTKQFEGILQGKKLNYPYLTKTQNRILTMRALGKSRPQIARALSGGLGRRSYTASSIKYMIQTSLQKIREHDMKTLPKSKLSVNLEKSIILEMDRIAKENGKTRSRVIHEACIEYIDEHASPAVWKTEHFEVDFNRFNRMRKQIMELENAGVTELGVHK